MVALSALAALAGCASAGEVIDLDEGTTLLVAGRSDMGDDALLQGELSVVGNCVGVADTVVIWPHGTKLVGDRELRIEVPGVGTYALGDQVSVGGGVAFEPPAHSTLVVEGVTVPASCAQHVVWMGAPSG